MTVLPVVFLYVTFLEFGHSHGTRTSETIIVTRIVVHASPAWLLWSLSFGSRHGVNRLWWSLRLSGAAVAKGAKLVCLLNYLIFLWFWWNSKYITTSGMVHAWKNIQRIRTSLHRCEWSGWISGSSHSFFVSSPRPHVASFDVYHIQNTSFIVRRSPGPFWELRGRNFTPLIEKLFKMGILSKQSK